MILWLVHFRRRFGAGKEKVLHIRHLMEGVNFVKVGKKLRKYCVLVRIRSDWSMEYVLIIFGWSIYCYHVLSIRACEEHVNNI